ncbi:MAG: NAD(P)/FAD-dependent oxidoreductase [Thermoplasmatota archaeon]
MRYDVAVIGAGPVGCTAARLLAMRGHRTVVLEEHPRVGEPVRCAGLVTPRVLDLACVDGDVVRQEVSGAVVHAPGGATVHVGGDRTHALAVDRRLFDRRMAERARAAGAELRCSWKVSGVRGCDGGFVLSDGSGRSLRCRYVVGADGVCSGAASALGFPAQPEHVQTLQAVVPGAGGGEDVDIWVGSRVAPGFFAWRIPADGEMRVGLGVSPGRGVMYFFRRMLDRLGVGRHELQAGLIPVGMRRRFCTDRAALVGDAAGQVKATSGGGLYPGLVAAYCLADALDDGTADYRRLFMRRYGRELKRSVWLRRRFVGLSDGEMDRLLGAVDEDVAAVVTAHGDIDFPWRVAKEVVKRRPGLLRYTLPF